MSGACLRHHLGHKLGIIWGMSRDAKRNLNSTDAKWAPLKLAPNLFISINRHQAALFGTGILAHINYSFSECSTGSKGRCQLLDISL